MIAKLVVHGANRDEALQRMRIALNEWKIVGVETNLEFLRRVVSEDGGVGVEGVDTGYIEVSLIRRHGANFQ